MSVWICGYRADVQVAAGDAISSAPYTIAANMEAEILKIQDQLPCTVTRSNDTLTLTARHAALSSADLPVVVAFSNTAMAVAASCGTLTYLNSAGADGTMSLGVATQTATVAITNGDTAAAIAANTITAINAAVAFPVTAAQTAPAAALTLFYANGRVTNWITTSITPAGTITTTLTPAVGTAGSGLPSSSTPSLSTVLTNIAALPAFRVWLTPFTGAGAYVTDAAVTQTGATSDYTNMGTFCTQLETQGNGVNQKGQVMVYGDTRKLTLMGGLISGTTPALTTSPRFFPCWCNASPQQAYEIAARCGADVITTMGVSPAIPYQGHILKTNAAVPLLSQTAATRPSDADCNAAMVTYYATPIRDNGQGQLVIVSGRTSAKPSASISGDYRWWPIQLLDDYVRDDMGLYLAPYLTNKSIKVIGQPVTPYTIPAQAIGSLVLARSAFYNANDWFDGGASDFKDLCKAEVNVALPSRIDVKMPKKFPIPLEQLGIVTEFAS
jgi:phage tail sheath gpL-like